MAINTDNARPSWSPDLISTFDADDLIPDALIVQAASFAGFVEGDAPAVRVPYVPTDATAAVVAEGGTISPQDPTLDEVVVNTDKVAQLVKTSREQLTHAGAGERIAKSMARAVTSKANDLFLNNAATPTGLAHTGSLNTAGDLAGSSGDVFAAYDAVGLIEDDGGTATHVLINPRDWATLAKIPEVSGSARSIMADVHDASRRSLAGVPVIVTPAKAQGSALVVDRSEVIAAYGQLELARSDDFYFDSDSVALRLTFRLGWKVARVGRLQLLTIDGGPSSSSAS